MIEFTGYTKVLFQDGEWVIGYIVEMPGCVAQERTFAECEASLLAALEDTIEHYKRFDLPIPAPGESLSIQRYEHGFSVYADVESEANAKMGR